MTEDIISFETAKLAKEKGFDVPCRYFYDNDGNGELWTYGGLMEHNNGTSEKTRYRCSAPTQSLLQKWLREEHEINVEIAWMFKKWFVSGYDLKIPMPNKTMCKTIFRQTAGYKTYEEALEIGLREALKLIP